MNGCDSVIQVAAEAPTISRNYTGILQYSLPEAVTALDTSERSTSTRNIRAECDLFFLRLLCLYFVPLSDSLEGSGDRSAFLGAEQDRLRGVKTV